MKILVINCHPDNRGDEAAVHAMVDEISAAYPGVEITLAIRGAGTKYPNMPLNVKMIHQFMPISSKAKLAHRIAVLTGGRVSISSNEKSLISEISKADIILHAPGGPSIGDTYYSDEPTYLAIYDLLIVMHKPYMFYAPSMGPFQREERNSWRKKVLEHSEAIVLRDPISEKYVRDFVPDKTISLTLDSAFQHDVNIEQNKEKLNQYMELKRFLEKHEKCVGVTITDLLWHTNLKGLFFMTQIVSNYMKEKKIKGHILNVSSAAALKPGYTPYEISKSGVRSFTLGAAAELIPYGIVVNAIAPGPVATAMLGRKEGDTLYTDCIPAKRFATPSEIGQLAVIMVSDMCDLVIGDTFYISGGSGTIQY